MNASFTLNVPNTNVGFGAVKTLPEEIGRFGAKKPLIITDKGLTAAGLVKILTAYLSRAGIDYRVFDELEACPSTETVKKVGDIVRQGSHDLLVGFGGGTAIDIAKAVGVTAISGKEIDFIMENPLYPVIDGPLVPKIFIPTTSGTGSEWSNVIVLFQYEPFEREIVTFSWNYMGDKVIIDPELTLGLPARITADTGFDAFCHAMEAYVTPGANVYTDMLATKAIEMVSGFLRRAVSDGGDADARYHMSLAAAFAMNACGIAGAGLCHVMNETLVPYTKASHGTALAVVAPAVIAYNMSAVRSKYAHVARLMGEDTSGMSEADAAARLPEAVRKLIRDIGLPTRLRDIGVTENDIPVLAGKLMEVNGPLIPLVNPRDADIGQIEGVFRAAL